MRLFTVTRWARSRSRGVTHGRRISFISTTKGARQLYEAALQGLGWLKGPDQMLELVLECRSRIHRGCQFRELVMKGGGYLLELALKSSHRFEAVRQILQVAVESLYRLEGRGHVCQLLLELSYRLEDVCELSQLTHGFEYLPKLVEPVTCRLHRIEHLGYGLVRSKSKE